MFFFLLSFRASAQQSDGLFVSLRGDHCGYIDRSGAFRIAPGFEGCLDFSDEYAPVSIQHQWGFIDKRGVFVITPRFEEIRWSFSEELAAVKLHGKWGYIDTRGAFVIPPKFEYAQGFSGDRAVVLVGDKHGVIDKSGNLVS